MLRPRPRTLLGVGIPIAVVVILLAAWAIDSGASGGRVMRNVQLAGDDVGRVHEDELTAAVREVADGLRLDARRDPHHRPHLRDDRRQDRPVGRRAGDRHGGTRCRAGPNRSRCARSTGSPRSSTARDAPLRFKVREDVLGLVLISLEGDGRTPADRAVDPGLAATRSASPAGRAGSPSTPRTSPAACWRRPRTAAARRPSAPSPSSSRRPTPTTRPRRWPTR